MSRKISEALSVHSRHTFSRSKGVDVAIFNLINCQSDSLFEMLFLIGVF